MTTKHLKRSPFALLLTLTLSLSLSACDGDDTTNQSGEMMGGEVMGGEMMGGEMMGGEMMGGELAIIGRYADEYSSHEITAERWTINYMNTTPTEPSIFHIERFDNDQGYLIAQNNDMNEYAPGKWSRFDWLLNGEELWYCQIAYEAENAEEAEGLIADPTDPSMRGCGEYPWSLLNLQ